MKNPPQRGGRSGGMELPDLDFPGLRQQLFRLGHRQPQHTVFKLGFNFIGIQVFDDEGPAGMVEAAFTANVVFGFFLFGLTTLGGNGQLIVADMNLDFILVEAGQFGLDNQFAVLLIDVGLDGGQAGEKEVVAEEVSQERARKPAVIYDDSSGDS